MGFFVVGHLECRGQSMVMFCGHSATKDWARGPHCIAEWRNIEDWPSPLHRDFRYSSAGPSL